MMHWLSSPARFVALLALLFTPSITAQDVIAPSESAAKSTSAAGSSRNDEVWLISTRHLCFPTWSDPQTYELDVRRYDRENGWIDASTNEYCGQPALPTLVYVHGNRVSWEEASQYGWQVYEAMAECDNAPPTMRFVIWTWPSDQIRGPLRDIRMKADRAYDETYFLGWFLSQQNPAAPVALLGYSYGSRIITGGLHLLAGGSLCGMTLPQPAKSGRSPARVALLAAALDNDWICPGNNHGAALELVEHMLVLYNTCDPALQRYCWVDRCSGAPALGHMGVANDRLGIYARRVEQMDVSSSVGRTHREDNYFRLTELKHEVCRVLFHPLPTPNDGD